MSNIAPRGSASSFRLLYHSSPSHTLFLFSLPLPHHTVLKRGLKSHLALPINFTGRATNLWFLSSPTFSISSALFSFLPQLLHFHFTPSCTHSWWACGVGEVSGGGVPFAFLLCVLCLQATGSPKWKEVFITSPSVFLFFKRCNWLILNYTRPNVKNLRVQVPKYQKYQLQYILGLLCATSQCAEAFRHAFSLTPRSGGGLKKDSFTNYG